MKPMLHTMSLKLTADFLSEKFEDKYEIEHVLELGIAQALPIGARIDNQSVRYLSASDLKKYRLPGIQGQVIDRAFLLPEEAIAKEGDTHFFDGWKDCLSGLSRALPRIENLFVPAGHVENYKLEENSQEELDGLPEGWRDMTYEQLLSLVESPTRSPNPKEQLKYDCMNRELFRAIAEKQDTGSSQNDCALLAVDRLKRLDIRTQEDSLQARCRPINKRMRDELKAKFRAEN